MLSFLKREKSKKLENQLNNSIAKVYVGIGGQ